MKIRFSQLLLCCLLVSLNSCKKDAVELSTNLESFMKNNEVKSKYYIIDTNKDTVIVTNRGTEITIPSKTFLTKNGDDYVSGKVSLEFKEILKKSDMILSDKPTTSDGKILISGGEFYINASQNNENLKFIYNKIMVESPTDNIISDMELFNGQSSTNGFNWVPNDTSFFNVNIKEPFSYLFSVTRLGWLNCDAFYQNQGPKTPVIINIGNRPPTDTKVYLVFKDINSVMGTYESQYQGMYFSSGNMPVGSNVTVIGISSSNGKLFLASEDVIIINDQSINLNFNEVTEGKLKSFLETLN